MTVLQGNVLDRFSLIGAWVRERKGYLPKIKKKTRFCHSSDQFRLANLKMNQLIIAKKKFNTVKSYYEETKKLLGRKATNKKISILKCLTLKLNLNINE